MDFKPFIPEGNYWEHSWMWILGFALLTAAAFALYKLLDNKWMHLEFTEWPKHKDDPKKIKIINRKIGFYLFGKVVSVILIIVTAGATFFSITGIPHLVAIGSQVNELVESYEKTLNNNGFIIRHGTMPFETGSKDTLVLNYAGNDYICDVFVPESETASMVFSCGTDGLSLTDIKTTE